MYTQLEKDIYDYLKTRRSIYFKVRLNIQGGPLVEVYLKRVKVGEFYEWDSSQQRHVRKIVGTEQEAKLGDQISGWVHHKVFAFMSERDDLEYDSFKGRLFLEEDQVYAEFPGGYMEFGKVG